MAAVELLLFAGGGATASGALTHSAAPVVPVVPVGAPWSVDSLSVARASVAWMQALQRRDTRALDTLMATGYRLSAPTDTAAGVDKATWIRNAQTILATDSAAYRTMRFHAVAPDVVVGSGMLYWRTRLRGWPVPVHAFAVTDVWVREADTGRWQIVVRNAELAPPVLLTVGALAGAALTSVLWALIAWWQRRRRRRDALPPHAARARDANSATVPAT